ncbi:hypothetical protein P8452_38254 [Trifolium repens]|nr:hypothetical protein P8452_38254 [Trifolium repens]
MDERRRNKERTKTNGEETEKRAKTENGYNGFCQTGPKEMENLIPIVMCKVFLLFLFTIAKPIYRQIQTQGNVACTPNKPASTHGFYKPAAHTPAHEPQ